MKDLGFHEGGGRGGNGIEREVLLDTGYLDIIKQSEDNPDILHIYLDSLCGEELFAIASYLVDSDFPEVREKAEVKLAQLEFLREFESLKNSTLETIIHVLLKEECCIEEIAGLLIRGECAGKIDEILKNPYSPLYDFASVLKQKSEELKTTT